jgi:Tfp pilus assembly protein PilW
LKTGIAIVCCALPLSMAARADQAASVRSAVEEVAVGLSAGNPAEAMTAFDKSYRNYDKLSSYFDGLTSAFRIVNEVDVVAETDAASETKITVHWTITLTDLGTNYTERREGDIDARLVVKERKWKIVDFAPIGVFDPQSKPPSK